MAPFTVEGMHHALVAARLSAEFGIAVRHGCFCAHPYVIRLLGLDDAAVDAYRREVLRGDHRTVPGRCGPAPGLGTSGGDVDALLSAVADLAAGLPAPVPYGRTRPPATSSRSPTPPAGGMPPRSSVRPASRVSG